MPNFALLDTPGKIWEGRAWQNFIVSIQSNDLCSRRMS